MRLIDADALYETLCHVWDRSDIEDFEKAVFSMFDIGGVAQTIDAVEVVRCGECRHIGLFSCPLADNDFQKDDDYCSWGERREEGRE